MHLKMHKYKQNTNANILTIHYISRYISKYKGRYKIYSVAILFSTNVQFSRYSQENSTQH